ncbi:MAG: SurA N-terminal domain-containing protein [Pseudomonadota bacterium]
MLDFLRRSIKSWVAKILLALLIVSFAVWGIGDIFTGSAYSTVATVGTAEVDSQSFANAVVRQQNQISRQRRAAVSLEELRAAGVDEQTLAALVRDAAFRSELAELEIAVPPDAVRDNIRTNPAFLDGQGQFSQFEYQNRLSQEGFNVVEFEDLTRALLGQQILVDATGNGGALLPGAAEQMAKWRGEERGILYAVLPRASAAEPSEPSDANLQAFFDENNELFREPERRWGQMLHTDIAALAGELAPTDEEIRAAYDADTDRYTQDATRTLEQIVFADATAAEDAATRLKDGTATFAEIAEEQGTSADALSLGTVLQDDLPEATGEAAFSATEPGILGPVDGPFGPVLLNVTGVELGGQQTFEEVEDLVRTRLLQSRIGTRIPEIANQIDEIRAGGAELPELADQTGVPLIDLNGIAQDFTVAGGEFPIAAYDQRLLADIMEAGEGEERDLIELSDGSYALVMIERIEASHLPLLAEIRDKVSDAWKDDQRLIALEGRAVGMLTGDEAGAGFTEMLTAAGLEPVEPETFTRESAPSILTPELLEAVFTADQDGYVSGRNRTGDGVIVAQVASVAKLEGEDLTAQTEEMETALQSSLARDHLEYFARAIEARQGISINRGAIESLFEQMGQARQGY